ncbi:MAG: ATP-binding protein [Rhodocyclaceae bacterium]|nr:ATP-binding protein [Rhodocyclaceae bacterium]MDZ4214967.1 ATP-binding protein [Rhodocyclaceae bacterium]
MSSRLVLLRWWWVAGLTLAVLSAPTFLAIALPLPPLIAVLLLLAGFNFIAQRRATQRDFDTPELAAQLGIDLTGMSVLLYLTGGATNPLVSLLLLPVAIAALTLPGVWVVSITGIAIAAYSFLMVYSLPLAIADAERATRLHLAGMWLTFLVSSALIAWFITRMTAAIRQRDAQLAEAREAALHNAQVVALGQLAAGAAHELGTPLATMNILTGELMQDRRLPEDAQQDLQLMHRQIALCKDLIGGLTRRAGIGRAGDVQRVAVTDWLVGLLSRWRSHQPQASCAHVIDTPGEAPTIDATPALEQAVINLLNNAAQVTSQEMQVHLTWDAGEIRIAVHDQGPGFPADVLKYAGDEPVVSQTQGAGIGLWLTRAAARQAGGRLELDNLTAGAVATIILSRQGLEK